MTLSIITVCRNNVATIGAALESVLRQRRNGFELEYLIIDGGSTDGTREVIEDFARKNAANAEIRWISEPDRGIYDAMNKGIRMSRGEVIGLVNSDDRLASDDVLEKIAKGHVGVDAVYGDIRFERRGQTVRYCSGKWFRPWMFRFAVFPPHPSTFIRRACFEKWGYYDVGYRISGDFDLLLRFIWLEHMTTRYLPLCTHIMTPGGASTDLHRRTEMELEDVRSIRSHGFFTFRILTWLRYPFKILEVLRPRLAR